MINCTPTKRMHVDVGHKCNVNCWFCYHRHEGDLTRLSFIPRDEIVRRLARGRARGCDYVDFTGGEPTLLPELPGIVVEAREKYDLLSCVITNAMTGPTTLAALLDAGVDDFLVSFHGLEATHDALVEVPGARKRQLRFIDQLVARGRTLRMNLTINGKNFKELPAVAREIVARYPVRIVNFINFNPHHAWSLDREASAAVLAPLAQVTDPLNEAIEICEVAGLGVNVRYFPMCRLDKKYRRCVCNDLHVTFDPYEWDYDIFPKTVERHVDWGHAATANAELKKYGCAHCFLRNICGGVNKLFYEYSLTPAIAPILDPDDEVPDPFDFYHYRRHNDRTLTDRRAP